MQLGGCSLLASRSDKQKTAYLVVSVIDPELQAFNLVGASIVLGSLPARVHVFGQSLSTSLPPSLCVVAQLV